LLLSVICAINCQDFTQCGRTKERTEPKGNEAGPSEFPHMCSLYLALNGFNVFVGGASLVAPDKILTLASAVKNYKSASDGTCREEIKPRYDLYVVCGSVNLQVTDEEGEQKRAVAEILLHPEFNEKSLINDVAVLLVDQPFELSENVGAVCLPAPGSVVEVNATCVATGHGKDEDIGYFTNTLRKVSLPVWSNVECENSLNRNYFQQNHSITWKIHESFICAGGEENYDTCEGDGGGPLVCPSNSVKAGPSSDPEILGNSVSIDEFDLRESGAGAGSDSPLVQVGVTAWGVGCGQTNIPSVYSSLTSPAVRCWLDQIMSCYAPSGEVAGQFDLRSTEDTPDSQAGLSESQCGSWLDNPISDGAACGCRQKLVLNSPDSGDFDLRTDGAGFE